MRLRKIQILSHQYKIGACDVVFSIFLRHLNVHEVCYSSFTPIKNVIEFCSNNATCTFAASKIEFFVGLVPESKLHQRSVSFQDCKFERLGLNFELISFNLMVVNLLWPVILIDHF